MAFSRLHVFRYSARPGTAAASYPEQVSPRIAASRSQAMREAGVALAEAYHWRLVGKVVPVLFESRAGGRWVGLTDSYVRAAVASDLDLHNRLLPVRPDQADARGLYGELVNAS
jgi:threonylcarbamoyladenosine tRNA methylthiotransferase MtaB